jgi:hypothetical protein
VTDPGDYARQVESYLCQKNRGHLIRVVGPAFDLVCGWAAVGVPLKVALRGIDRCCERLEARGPRRRPVRIEFCEADVLEAFDDWRRAVGVTAAVSPETPEADTESTPRKPALAAHVERAIARLAHARGAGPSATPQLARLERTIRDLESVAAGAARARGEARAAIVARLAEIDSTLIAETVADLTPAESARLRAEANAELLPFGARMPEDARARALDAAFERLVREAAGLPTLRYE